MLKTLLKRVLCAVLTVSMMAASGLPGTVQAAEETIKVACVGDSLTDGYLSSGGNKSSTAYPAYLQGLLGDDYEVGNFGKTSMTLLKDTDRSYWNTSEYTSSLAYEPDIVIIMLGSNDSKPAYWDEAAFKDDAVSLVNQYAALETNPRIIFATSPQCYQTSGTDITRDSVAVVAEVQRALVEENEWETVDMYAKTEDRQDLYHSDKLHFTDGGYFYIAQCMYEAITGEVLPDTTDDSRDIPVDVLTVTAGDSQSGEGPERVLDQDSSTLWHTDWYGTSRENHWIQFELSDDYLVDGLRYQPRQTGSNGTITEYEILVSEDGNEWKTAATGSWFSDLGWKLVSFEEQNVNYVRLVAVGTMSNSSYVFASAAEIRLTGVKAEAEVTPTPMSTPEPALTTVPEVTPTPMNTPEITPTETAAPTLTESVKEVFTDVYQDWYTEYVQYVYDNGLMTGIAHTTNFDPSGNVTKAQVAQVLYNMVEKPAGAETAVFKELKDVYEVEWYADAVAWAYENGVVTGDLNTKEFSPNADVTREQLALMLYRYAQYKKYNTDQTSDLEGLLNADKTADWSEKGVRWAVGSGLITGIETREGADLAPQGNATRAQMAAILRRFCESHKK